MAIKTVRLPDAREIKVNAPDDASDEDIFAFVSEQMSKPIGAPPVPKPPIPKGLQQPQGSQDISNMPRMSPTGGLLPPGSPEISDPRKLATMMGMGSGVLKGGPVGALMGAIPGLTGDPATASGSAVGQGLASLIPGAGKLAGLAEGMLTTAGGKMGQKLSGQDTSITEGDFLSTILPMITGGRANATAKAAEVSPYRVLPEIRKEIDQIAPRYHQDKLQNIPKTLDDALKGAKVKYEAWQKEPMESQWFKKVLKDFPGGEKFFGKIATGTPEGLVKGILDGKVSTTHIKNLKYVIPVQQTIGLRGKVADEIISETITPGAVFEAGKFPDLKPMTERLSKMGKETINEVFGNDDAYDKLVRLDKLIQGRIAEKIPKEHGAVREFLNFHPLRGIGIVFRIPMVGPRLMPWDKFVDTVLAPSDTTAGKAASDYILKVMEDPSKGNVGSTLGRAMQTWFAQNTQPAPNQQQTP